MIISQDSSRSSSQGNTGDQDDIFGNPPLSPNYQWLTRGHLAVPEQKSPEQENPEQKSPEQENPGQKSPEQENPGQESPGWQSNWEESPDWLGAYQQSHGEEIYPNDHPMDDCFL
jgi:hypothetical protein